MKIGQQASCLLYRMMMMMMMMHVPVLMHCTLIDGSTVKYMLVKLSYIIIVSVFDFI